MNGGARHPQSQGLIEQANGHLKAKLAAWKEDNDSHRWTLRLPELILSMNSQVHSVTRKAPYTVVFGQTIYGNRLLPSERRNAEVQDWISEEAIDECRDGS
jgi:hypothetical protein